MSYRPDENVLISWMYGELDEVEKAKVDKFLQENPEELKKIQVFRGVKDIMGNIQDKEVIAPPLFMDNDVKIIPIWKTSSFRIITTIAASFLMLIVAGKVLDARIAFSNGEMHIGFGGVKAESVNTGLTAMDVQRMIDESTKQNQAALESRLAMNKTELDESIKKSLAGSTSQISKMVQTASQTQIREFVSGLQRENLAQMRDYLQLSVVEQRKYTDNLIIDFSKYLNEQRNADLGMFQSRFSRLEQNTDELKVETEQILASIISNAPQVQQSNY